MKKRIKMIISGYRLSRHAEKRLQARQEIKVEWIEKAIQNPLFFKEMSNDEWHFYRNIEEFNNKVLKVVVNPQKEIIITVLFDRRMKYEDRL